MGCISRTEGERAKKLWTGQFMCLLGGRMTAAGTAEPQDTAHQTKWTQHLLEHYWGALVFSMTEKEARGTN